MKKFLGLSVLALSLSSFAQDDLTSMKQKANQHIDQKMSTLQTAKGCVNSATTTDKFKACKYDMKEDMKMQKMEMIEEKKNEKQSE